MSNSSYRTSRADKQLQDKLQAVLSHLLREEDNKYCADCDAKGPRWASWNLGIFVCIRCAGIHRNLGVHISRVKSVNLDSWTDEQVGSMQNMGNSKGRAVYEASLPDSFRRPQNDSPLETFIRAKYESKKYIAKEWVAPTKPMKTDFSVLGRPTPAARAPEKRIELNSLGSSVPRPNSSSNMKEIVSPSSLSQASPTQASPSDDLFADFISAPLPSSVSVAPADASAEENDFFNQVAADSRGSSATAQSNASAGPWIDKESILSLYSKTTQAQVPMQLLTQNTVNPLVNAGVALPINTQMANNPFLMGGLMSAPQPAFNLGLAGQQPCTRPPIQQGLTLISNSVPRAKFEVATFNGVGAPVVQQPNLPMMNSQFAGLHLGDSSAGVGLSKPDINPAANGNSTLSSNLWN